MEPSLDYIPALLPSDFFSLRFQIYEVEGELKKKHLLPELQAFADERNFAKVSMGWSKKGLTLAFQMSKSFERAEFPHFQRGDAIELFFDTRDDKEAGVVHQFCHHFVVLPAVVDGVQVAEMTRFRGEEKRELADGDKVVVETKKKHVQIFLPSECLHGYDPGVFDRLGFAYRIHRYGGEPQHFFLSSKSVSMEQHPALWSQGVFT